MSCNIDRAKGVLWGKVQASQRQEVRNVKVFYSLDKICSAECSCPIGKYGRCHHIAALLLYGNRNISVTDVACSWTLKKKAGHDNEGLPIDHYYPPTRPNYQSIPGPLSVEEVREARKNLPSCKGAALSIKWLTDPEPELSTADNNVLDDNTTATPTVPTLNTPAIEEAIRSPEFRAAADKCRYLINFFKLSPSDIADIATATCGQSSVLLCYCR
ncbi:hypothetical protein FOCC_FOCC016588 [Frankliniella occidentalis]|nr:hypothetical protein FOCC_FOCC016588 [Frankliniella occidentalis]